MVSTTEQETINQLQANWVWAPDWIDASSENTAGRLVRFTRDFDLSSPATRALLYFSADTRYKLYVNGTRVAVGPARSSALSFWYYDTLDIARFLGEGRNVVVFVVMRYFAASRAAMPFARSPFPGLTVVGAVEAGSTTVDLASGSSWVARVDEDVLFPTGLPDDVFLHISERVSAAKASSSILIPKPYRFKTLNGELPPWRLQPRAIPMPEESRVDITHVPFCQSARTSEQWMAWASHGKPMTLASESAHVLDLQADTHSTAFLRWQFKADVSTSVKMKITYSEGYELEPRDYPFFRSKKDRLDAKDGFLIGPYDEVSLEVQAGHVAAYEPFWFRTFRVMRVQLDVGAGSVQLLPMEATQVNYPLAVKASWEQPGDADSAQIWDVSIRTMRNCMFDGYSDCPFYEQLQYSGDSRTVGMFHYLLSGDDRLMRQAISNFAASITAEGLTQSRFPSHVPQVIAGFSLYWILQVCDHHLFFKDESFARSFLPRVDGVLEFFNSYVDDLGLVSGLPEDVWQYVDWVTAWGATEDHPDKGVPTSGRKSNRHTYFSMLYAHVLQVAAQLVRNVGRPGHADEYTSRATAVVNAVKQHCYDGRFFTDSTADVAGEGAYSQHCQVFAVLCGAAAPEERGRLLTESLADLRFSKCSYMMKFYVLRALALAGDDVYEFAWAHIWDPWRKMLACNLTTWEEDDVRQRSDCHAWGSVPVYEFCTELAGVQPLRPGFSKILFKPRLRLTEALTAKVALGKDNVASVRWVTDESGTMTVTLQLETPAEVVTQLPAQARQEQGCTDHVKLVYSPPLGA